MVAQSGASGSHITLVPVHTDTDCILNPVPAASFHCSGVVVFVITVIILCFCICFAMENVPTPSMLLANIGRKSITLPEFLKVNLRVMSTSLRELNVERFGFNNTSSKFNFGSLSILIFFLFFCLANFENTFIVFVGLFQSWVLVLQFHLVKHVKSYVVVIK